MLIDADRYLARHRDALQASDPDAARALFEGAMGSEADLENCADASGDAAIRDRLYRETSFRLEEVVAVVRVAEGLRQMMSRHFGKARVPGLGLLAAVPSYRLVTGLISGLDGAALSVMEIGTGPGCLGGLLVNEGIGYVGVDADPGRYLWQNRVLDFFCGGEMTEGALDERDPPPVMAGRAVHLPWWRLDDEAALPNVDVVLCNRNLARMRPRAVDFLFRAARRALKASSVGFLLCPAIGDCGTREHVREALCRYHFRQVFLTGLTVFRPQEVPVPECLRAIDLLSAGGGNLYPAESFLSAADCAPAGDGSQDVREILAISGWDA